MAVSSLFDSALHAVMRDFTMYEQLLWGLPRGVKTKLLEPVTKRGLLSERNITVLLHEDVLELDLSECEVSAHMLQFISSVCSRLRKLSLNSQHGCRPDLTSKALSQMFSHCKRLTTVNLRCCTLTDDSAVSVLTNANIFLVSLCLSGCHMISDRGLYAISQKCRYLQVLDLTKTKRQADTSRLAISHWNDFTKGSQDVTSDGLQALSQGVCVKVLKELNISHCLNVTDEGVQALVKECPRLTILVTHSCPQLTNKSRDAVSNLGLKQLTWTIYV